ncbi:MAG TPA: Dyp-type peroxidase [Flavihumibacter sp.]|nr:Dyp-type peroxidase [Bacteroidota bacterium]HOA38314.1 Dyp-type peroxidase [Flavihumibacter sp.]HPZ87203.1 Dyp-type peroxidase [Flavihumibacter sp.]HQD09122.1 Dyp-type peroxidase [Flavihumibacter sp.]
MPSDAQNILDYHGSNAIFLVWNFNDNMAVDDAFKNICALVINLNNSMAIRFPDTGASCVMGIGYEAWHRLHLPTPLPKEFEVFEPVIGAKHQALSTRGDLHFHIRGNDKSICYDMANAISAVLQPVASSVEEIHGFRYWDGRSILGFVDGTENPQGEKRAFFGMIGANDPAYSGGSYLFVQKYVHNLTAFNALPLHEQEKVFGRSKRDDIEMPENVKPSNSHSALANVGDDFKIIRDNLPFGNMSTNEMGTYFIAYASQFSTVKKMLTNMFIGSPEGNYDRLLDFSTPKTGTLFFVPTLSFLKAAAAGELESEMPAPEPAEKPAPAKDGSLNIGNLKSEKEYE